MRDLPNLSNTVAGTPKGVVVAKVETGRAVHEHQRASPLQMGRRQQEGSELAEGHGKNRRVAHRFGVQHGKGIAFTDSSLNAVV
jgi:hypothetical protein